MIEFLLLGAGLLVILALAWIGLRTSWTRRQAIDRLDEDLEFDEPEGVVLAPVNESGRKRWTIVLPFLFGPIVGLVLYYLLEVPAVLSIAFGLISIVVGILVESSRAAKRAGLLEYQLADSIDLMIGSLRAGVGALDALTTASIEAPKPVNRKLQDLVGRLRLGEDPQEAVRHFQTQTPLPAFHLLGSALAVHWEVGGSLAPVLAGVARTIRDRVELSRRVRAQTTQARGSVVAILLLTYFIAVVMWRAHPERMEGFLGSDLGRGLSAAAMLLQTAGMLWIARMSRIPL